jgi:pyrroline-5-carboxylate reductase
MKTYNLLLVGHGNMGAALLSGWQDAGLIGRAVVVDPHQPTVIPDKPQARSGTQSSASENFEGLSQSIPGSRVKPGMTDKVVFVAAASEIPPSFTPDIIILAVKPQAMAAILPDYKKYAGHGAFLSIAAGKTITFFEQHLGAQTPIIRAMPNLPATVRRGASVCTANAAVTETQKQAATALLEAVGTVHWAAEAQLDAVTALSGSGPAYVFYLAEVLAEAGAELGLPAELANALARETIAGAGELLRQSPDSAAILRQKVTSPGGTTEAALKLLMKNEELLDIVRKALQAAASRAAELA